MKETEPSTDTDPGSVPTVKSEGSDIVATVSGEGFDLIDVLELIQKGKQGAGNKLELSVATNSFNQDFFSVGAYPFNDLIVTKNFPIGTNTSFVNSGDTYKVTDYSNLNIA